MQYQNTKGFIMQTLDQLILDENNIAFHPMMGNSYQLNGIGATIVSLLREHKSKEEILDELCSRYEIKREDLYIDLSDFLTKLKAYGLLV